MFRLINRCVIIKLSKFLKEVFIIMSENNSTKYNSENVKMANFANEDIIITDEENKILCTLENPRYKWRTVSGISAETLLSNSTVSGSIEHLSTEGLIITASSTSSITGESLYTSKERYVTSRAYRWNRFLSVLSDEIK
jgi:hypothetical protein